MKRLTVLIFLILYKGIPCISQDSIYILHPTLGEIIDRHEKINFSLFPEIPNSRFEYSCIKQTGETFWLESHVFPDSLITRQLDTSEIHQAERKLIKLLTGYPTLRKTDDNDYPGKEARSVVIMDGSSGQINNKILYPGTIERISSESISNERLRDDSESLRLWRQGSNMDNGSMLLDFSYRKRKNK